MEIKSLLLQESDLNRSKDKRIFLVTQARDAGSRITNTQKWIQLPE
jgi:hypothetical protein